MYAPVISSHLKEKEESVVEVPRLIWNSSDVAILLGIYWGDILLERGDFRDCTVLDYDIEDHRRATPLAIHEVTRS